jgi:hypothetical protein
LATAAIKIVATATAGVMPAPVSFADAIFLGYDDVEVSRDDMPVEPEERFAVIGVARQIVEPPAPPDMAQRAMRLGLAGTKAANATPPHLDTPCRRIPKWP